MTRRIPILVLSPGVLAALLASACGGPPQSRAGTERREAPAPRTRMDSATAVRLCANAEQVRAGLAACELRDQAIPPRSIPRTPPPPPR
jgi:hypothetical protein